MIPPGTVTQFNDGTLTLYLTCGSAIGTVVEYYIYDDIWSMNTQTTTFYSSSENIIVQ